MDSFGSGLRQMARCWRRPPMNGRGSMKFYAYNNQVTNARVALPYGAVRRTVNVLTDGNRGP
jgi:hypothetical protein